MCNPSLGMSSGCHSLPEVMHSVGTPCMREVLHFQLVIGTQHAQTIKCINFMCINAMPEGCFIIEVIAVFSRLTFVSGVD